MHSFKNGCTYVISNELLESEANGVGSNVPAAPCTQAFSAAQTVLEIQSGAKIVVIKPHVLTLPPDPDMGWKMVHKVISSQTRVCHAPGTQWAILPSPEEPLG